MPCEHFTNACALESDAATMDQPYFAESLFGGSFEVAVHHARNFAGLKAMQIDRILDLDDRDCIGIGGQVVVAHLIGGGGGAIAWSAKPPGY
jgi:hypothetical protein